MSFRVEYKKVWRGEEVKIRGRKVVNKSAFETGLVVERQAKALCPVDTGRLAASITTQARTKGTTPKGKGARLTDVITPPADEGEVYVGTPVEYGPYIEYGTYRSEAQSFLRPALALAKGEQLTILMHNGRAQFREYLRA
jgi:hypothetical protein